MMKRFPIIWILVYLIIIGGSATFAASLFEDIKEEQLPDGNIELLTNKDKYQLGEKIEFTVINHFPVSIFVANQCPNEPLNVYVWQGKEWTQIHDSAKDTAECYTEDRNVEILPEKIRNYDFSDWPNLFTGPGVYRLAMVVDHSDDIFFKDFVILEPAKVLDVSSPDTAVSPNMSTEQEETIEPELPEENIKIYESEDDDRYEYEDEDDD